MKMKIPAVLIVLLFIASAVLHLHVAQGPGSVKSGARESLNSGAGISSRADEQPETASQGGTWYDSLNDREKVQWTRNARVAAGSAVLDSSVLRRAVRVNNPGGVLSDFQLQVILTAENFDYSNVRADGRDIRFIDEDRNELPYWMESWNPGGTSKIWVRASSLPTGNSVLWMYFGDGAVHGASDGAATFHFFEDFDSLDGSRWSSSGNCSVDGGQLTVTRGAVYTDNAVASQPGLLVEARMKWNNFATYSGLCIADARFTGASNQGRNKLVYLMTGTSGSRAISAWAASGTAATYNIAWGQQQFTAVADIWYTMGYVVEGNKVTIFKDGVQTNSLQGTWAAPFFVWLGYYRGSASGYANCGDITAERITVRKYAALQPLITVGPEQSPESFVVSGNITLPNEMSWDRISVGKSEPPGTSILLSVLNAASNASVEGFADLDGSIIDAGGLNRQGVTKIRLRADIMGTDTSTPVLDGWGVEWRPESTWRDGLMRGERISGDGGRVVGGTLSVGYNRREPGGNTTALWHFEDMGGVLSDASHNKINGTVLGAEPVKGIIGRALYFDGGGSYVELTEGDPALPLHDEVLEHTVEIWFSADNLSGRHVLYEEGGSINGLGIYIFDRSLYAGAWSDWLGYAGDWMSAPIGEGWHHCAFTYSASERISRLYIDGEPVNSTANGGRLGNHTGAAAIGATMGGTKYEYGPEDRAGPLHSFEGAIDEMVIYDRMLSGDEIREHSKVFRAPFTARSEVISLEMLRDWGVARAVREVPEGTSLNLSVVDAGTDELLLSDTGNFSEVMWSLDELDPILHGAVYFSAHLVPSPLSAPSLEEWSVNWTPARMPVMIRPVDNIEVVEETPRAAVLDLDEFFNDSYAEMKNSVYEVDHLSDEVNVTMNIDDSRLDVSYLAENFTGTVSVRVNCTNLHGLIVTSNTFQVTVANVDDAPVWISSPPPIELLEDVAVTTGYSLYEHVFDVEGDELEFFFTGTSSNLTTEVSREGNITVAPGKNFFGEETITVTVRENGSDGLSASTIIPVRVTSVNDAPEPGAAPGVINLREDEIGYIELDQYFTDADDSEFLYTAETGDSHIDASVLENLTLRLVPAKDWSGLSSVVIAALDPPGDAGTIELGIIVQEINDPPRSFIVRRAAVVDLGDPDVMISGGGSDVDGTVKGYRWTSDRDGIVGENAGLNTSGANLSLGTHLLSFAVRDDDDAWSDPAYLNIEVVAASLETSGIGLGPGNARDGEEITVTVALKNTGTAEAREVTVRFMVDGTDLYEAEIPLIPVGEQREAKAFWTASPGRHAISAEILIRNETYMVISGNSSLGRTVRIESANSYGYAILSAVLAVAIPTAVVAISLLLRKRRRKRIVDELERTIDNSGQRGMAVGDSRDVLRKLREEFQ